VFALAEAPIEDVMAHWAASATTPARATCTPAPGAWWRIRRRVPGDPALLADLPGIGRSTAAAIAAFSNGTRAAILDGNVKRVFARVFGIDAYPGEKPVEDALWRRAEALLPADGIEAYTQGLMDLGATLCTRSKPDCGALPAAGALRRLRHRPHGRTAGAQTEEGDAGEAARMLVVIDRGQVLLEQRPGSGIWGGLLSLPEVDGHVAVEEIDAAGIPAAAARSARWRKCEALLPLVHVFTHYKLHIHPTGALARACGDAGWVCVVGSGEDRGGGAAGAGQEAAGQLGQPNLLLDTPT
jgi:A/G-specific adenine glycosylase